MRIVAVFVGAERQILRTTEEGRRRIVHDVQRNLALIENHALFSRAGRKYGLIESEAALDR